MTLAVVDDIAAIGIIAVFYTDTIEPEALAVAFVLIGAIVAAQRVGVSGFLPC